MTIKTPAAIDFMRQTAAGFVVKKSPLKNSALIVSRKLDAAILAPAFRRVVGRNRLIRPEAFGHDPLACNAAVYEIRFDGVRARL